jgi:hypothetical protein
MTPMDELKRSYIRNIIKAQYQNIFYVAPSGTNTNGQTWATAFITLNAAIAAASASPNSLTLIMIAPGLYDVDCVGGLNVNKQVHIFTAHRRLVNITNSNMGATHCLTMSNTSIFECLTFDMTGTRAIMPEFTTVTFLGMPPQEHQRRSKSVPREPSDPMRKFENAEFEDHQFPVLS